MKTIRVLICALALSLGLFAGSVFSHDVPVHWAITVNAAASAFDNSSSYTNFLATISKDCTLNVATNALVLGSGREDAPFKGAPSDGGGHRSMNHFYDPLDHVYGHGLSDTPPDRRVVAGTNSFAWGSISNSLGYNYFGAYYMPFFGRNVGTSNIWSWQNARGYEWLGLTGTNQTDRQAALTNMFRAIGQVMHLLEDASQPQHVRNEQHLEGTGWQSPIEDYGFSNVRTLNFQHAMLDWRGGGFKKLEDFWDRHLYNGNSAALNAETNGGTNTLGLAEWCNGNFLGDRHTYGEYFPTNDIGYYPYPSLYTSTSFPKIRTSVFLGTRTVTLKNDTFANRIYVDKIGDGITFSNHSVLTYLGAYARSGPLLEVSSTIRDSNVLAAYHAAIIPKAVKYSAGLLDYFFRGQIVPCVSISADDDGNWILTIQNSSSNTWSGGTFTVLQEAADGTRSNLLQSALTGTLSDGDTTQLQLLGEPSSDIKALIIVYQGTIGLTGTDPSDPVDAGLAIAATKITFGTGPDWSQMNWDTANFYNGGSSGSAVGDTVQFSLEGEASTPFYNGVAEVHGSLSYTGGPAIGKLHINLDSVNDTDFGIKILQDSKVVLHKTIDDLIEGDNDFTFPISCGNGSTIEVEGDAIPGYNYLMGLAEGAEPNIGILDVGTIAVSLKLSN